ncbi:MAG: hypothetical protein A4E36_00804 [Methanoregulaceae archaeon PtaB.Bin009]|nr:MAG: hypothetical protein A4E36_00804 [Methanoregulaceae archaeon PtaB.Bin009]OPY42101.1 MAG: hypothetical protein A4E41_00566 [Methanoregulaceae archaeon PtaU1.Bin066]
MKKKNGMIPSRMTGIILLLAISCIAATVLAATSAEDAASYVSVNKVTVEPATFMPDDAGTITVDISNGGTAPVAIYRAEILSQDIKVLNYQTYDSVGAIGPGTTMQFTFRIKPEVEDGMYFPMFYLDFTDAGSLRYPVPLEVDSTPVTVSVVSAPASFSSGTKEQVVLSVSNPRNNAVNSVTAIPGGDGIRSTQSSVFIGTLEPDEEKKATFEITAERDTTMAFDVSYRNGNNLHHLVLEMPVTVGEGGTAAEMVVNNVEVVQAGSTFTLSGDVTNAGLRDAKSVKVTVDSPAVPVDPNPVYVIGALEPDDFSSFEVTCTVRDVSSIPLIIQYRDKDGKVFEDRVNISIRSTAVPASGEASGASQGLPSGNTRRPGGMLGFGNGISKIPVTEILIVIAACIAVAVAWRKGYLGKAVDIVRKRSGR